ncbi:MAG: hypothetical protein ABEJ93_01630 [Candidatus Nanohalobium sp.]
MSKEPGSETDFFEKYGVSRRDTLTGLGLLLLGLSYILTGDELWDGVVEYFDSFEEDYPGLETVLEDEKRPVQENFDQYLLEAVNHQVDAEAEDLSDFSEYSIDEALEGTYAEGNRFRVGDYPPTGITKPIETDAGIDSLGASKDLERYLTSLEKEELQEEVKAYMEDWQQISQ